MNYISTFLKKEWDDFHKLNRNAQMLLASYTLGSISDPMIFMFVNAFLWRKSSSIQLVAWYNFSFFLSLPIGFYLNGLFLRKFRSPSLYMVGCLMEGIVVSSLMFFSPLTYPSLFIFGVLFGIGCGLYWANRNIMSLRATVSSERIYFTSLESALSTPTGILVPLIIGYFLTLGDKFHIYSVTTAYQVLSLFAIAILFLVGAVVSNVNVNIATIKEIFVIQATAHWKAFRIFTFFEGLAGGVSIFLPTLMVLTFVGQEDTLGLVQALASMLSAFAIYMVGKKLSIQHRIYLFWILFGFTTLSALAFGFFFSAIGVLTYFALQSLGGPFSWTSITSLAQDTIDTEEKTSPHSHYSFVFDTELFLNLGRISGIGILVLLIHSLSSTFALRYILLALVPAQLLFVLIAKKLDKTNLKHVEKQEVFLSVERDPSL